jgi:hypothetical protein
MLGGKRRPTLARDGASAPPSVATLLGALLGLWLLTEAVLYLKEHGSDVVGAPTGGGGLEAAAGPTPGSIHVVLTSNGNSCAWQTQRRWRGL